MLARVLVPLAILAVFPRATAAGYISEFPRAPVVVQYHPSAAAPFVLGDVDSALQAGAHAVELDLRRRPTDGAVTCSHLKEGLEARPTLAEAIERILSFQGGSPTVQRDGLQFYLVLDLKDDSQPLAAGIVQTLRRYADHWSTAVDARGGPRAITVVVSGKRSHLARDFPPQTLDSLCVLEGVSYGSRIEDRSMRGGTFQWISLKHRVERGRVRALQLGRDRTLPGRFNVRIYGCRGALESCSASGADAVNADQDELKRAMALADSVAAARRGSAG